MVKTKDNQSFSQMYLANALEGEVKAWVEQGWPGVTQTMIELEWEVNMSIIHVKKINLSSIFC